MKFPANGNDRSIKLKKYTRDIIAEGKNNTCFSMYAISVTLLFSITEIVKEMSLS